MALSLQELDRVIEMAWEDRTPLEAIAHQFQLSEKDVIKLMRAHLIEQSFKRWRKRVIRGKRQKHL
ncbi:MAG: TIGR03643 family protein [Flavobacteriaceae bacterium]|nr:TIGR03643 family protein [Flavobacteriaceae bacterium]